MRLYRKNRGKFAKKVLYKRPTAHNQKKQIYKLAKTVARHSRAIRSIAVISRYHQHTNTTLTSQFNVINLTDCSSWSSIFDNASQPQNVKKHRMLSCALDMKVSSYSELSHVTFTYYLVSLKVGTGAKGLVEQAGESLGTLIQDEHYTFANGKALLNLKYFNVIQCKRFSVGEYGDTASASAAHGTNQLGTFKRWYKKVSWKRSLTDSNTSNILNIPKENIPLSSRIYCIMFNNNSSVDGEWPVWDVSAIWTCKT